MYKNSSKGSPPVVLRSYDSRREPPPEFDCRIWEAGRATCAIGLAFKSVQIGQSVFHDDGSGTFNPSPEALDEAVVNEWPGREVGVFVSVGTGRRPKGSDANQSMWYEGFLGEFAEARRRLIAKIEGCEVIHERMKKELLAKRNVNIENYYRFNVEIGVGEFGMNEWNRLADISTNTKRYLSREAEQKMIQTSSAKLAKIQRANERLNRLPDPPNFFKTPDLAIPLAVELPGDIPSTWPSQNTPPSRASYESGQDNLAIPTGNTPSPRSSGERIRPPNLGPLGTRPVNRPAHTPPLAPSQPADEPDRLVVTAPTPAQYRYHSGSDKIAIMGPDEHPRWTKETSKSNQPQQQAPHRIEPPPLPPKTPLPENQLAGRRSGGNGAVPLPYPVDDEPPPVNMARKPDFKSR
jgi:hypothetical protein